MLAALGDGEAAVRALQAAFVEGRGWPGAEMHLDSAWDPIRTYPPFHEFMKPKGQAREGPLQHVPEFHAYDRLGPPRPPPPGV